MPIVGVDIGSSSVKACLFDLQSEVPNVLDQRSVDCSLKHPRKGWAEHDLQGLSAALEEVLQVAPVGATVGWSSAMHGLVLLDAQGRPFCDAISWADERSGEQARRLKADHPRAQARTGTPLHSMAWPAKLLWVREERPDWWTALSRVSDLKSFLWEKLTGERAPLDLSSASATGLWDRENQGWDESLCQALDIDRTLLPEVALDHRLLWKGLTLHLGGADGPLGNLGTGAVGENRVAISVGTSGAVRRFRTLPLAPPDSLFLYALDGLGWVEGGAISNGGSVLDWLQEKHPQSPQAIMAQAASIDPGAGGVVVHPYFSGERAPFWRSGVTPSISGETADLDFSRLARATLEGVAYCLHRLLSLLGDLEEPLRCTGGMFEDPFWCQLLADVTGLPVGLSPVTQATALGAALLTQPDALERSRRLPVATLYHPHPARHATYEQLYSDWLAADPAGR